MTAKQTPLVDLLRIHADDIHSAHGHNKSSTLLSQAADRIAALEAERDQLLNEIQLITAPHDSVGAVIAGIRAERDQLRAEIAECKRDAEIVRFLRCGGWEVLQDPKYWTEENRFYGAIEAAMIDVSLAAKEE